MGAAASKAANQAKTATLKNALEKYIAATKNLKNKSAILSAINNKPTGSIKTYKNMIANGVANAVVASRNGLIPETAAAVVVNNAAAKLNNLNKFPQIRNAFTPNNNPNGSNKSVKITRNTANSNWKFVNSANNSKYSINQTNKNKPVIKFKNTSANVANLNDLKKKKAISALNKLWNIAGRGSESNENNYKFRAAQRAKTNSQTGSLNINGINRANILAAYNSNNFNPNKTRNMKSNNRHRGRVALLLNALYPAAAAAASQAPPANSSNFNKELNALGLNVNKLQAFKNARPNNNANKKSKIAHRLLIANTLNRAKGINSAAKRNGSNSNVKPVLLKLLQEKNPKTRNSNIKALQVELNRITNLK